MFVAAVGGAEGPRAGDDIGSCKESEAGAADEKAKGSSTPPSPSAPPASLSPVKTKRKYT